MTETNFIGGGFSVKSISILRLDFVMLLGHLACYLIGDGTLCPDSFCDIVTNHRKQRHLTPRSLRLDTNSQRIVA